MNDLDSSNRLFLSFPENDFPPAVLHVLDFHVDELFKALAAPGGVLHGMEDDTVYLLEAIAVHWRDRHASPTTRELAREAGLHLVDARRHLRTLERRRLVVRWEASRTQQMLSPGPRLERSLRCFIADLDTHSTRLQAA